MHTSCEIKCQNSYTDSIPLLVRIKHQLRFYLRLSRIRIATEEIDTVTVFLLLCRPMHFCYSLLYSLFFRLFFIYLECAGACWRECFQDWWDSRLKRAPSAARDPPGRAAPHPAVRTHLPAADVGCTPSIWSTPCDRRYPEPSSPGHCCRNQCYIWRIWSRIACKFWEETFAYFLLSLFSPSSNLQNLNSISLTKLALKTQWHTNTKLLMPLYLTHCTHITHYHALSYQRV